MRWIAVAAGVLLVASLVGSEEQAAEEESPLIYTLEVNGQPHPIKPGKLLTLPAQEGPVKVLLMVAPYRVFRVPGAEVQRYAGTKKRAVQREVSRGHRPDTANIVGRGPSPSRAAIGAELKELARQAMELLPPDYRTVLHLALEERLRLREVAERMNRSRDAVKKLYGRALGRFKEMFDRLRGESHA